MGKKARIKERSYRGLFISLIAIGLLVAILTAAMIIFKPKVDIGAFFAPIGYFFSGVFTKVGKWPFVRWLAQLKLMQYVAIIAMLTAIAVFIRQMVKKNISTVMGLLWIATSIGFGYAFYFVAEGIGFHSLGIMFALANVPIIITSMISGGNSFPKSLGICAKQLIVFVPVALILGTIYIFAGKGIASVLVTIGQYLLLATSLSFQIWVSDPIRSM